MQYMRIRRKHQRQDLTNLESVSRVLAVEEPLTSAAGGCLLLCGVDAWPHLHSAAQMSSILQRGWRITLRASARLIH